MIHPTINTALNALSGVLLVLGLLAIRRGDRERHTKLMIGAVGASVAFLVSYLIYHATKLHTKYEGGFRPLYFTLLISHVVLAAVNLPMIIRTVWLARKKDWERHKQAARWTYPIWIYVSVSGVAVYVMLYLL
ncbi:MAG: DUF420 domain-containing protein [Planctomycetota bacterium]